VVRDGIRPRISQQSKGVLRTSTPFSLGGVDEEDLRKMGDEGRMTGIYKASLSDENDVVWVGGAPRPKNERGRFWALALAGEGETQPGSVWEFDRSRGLAPTRAVLLKTEVSLGWTTPKGGQFLQNLHGGINYSEGAVKNRAGSTRRRGLSRNGLTNINPSREKKPQGVKRSVF